MLRTLANFCYHVASVFFLLLHCAVVASIKSPNDSINQPLIITSTVDGKISALSIEDGGELMWSVDLEDGPLVSTSVNKLIYNKDGKLVRLIPSLHGGLFALDGDTLDPVPFDADHLLHSSFRFADNAALVGGKETSVTGIDVASGRILYSCSAKGCEQEQSDHESSDVIVVKRHQQTVRSIANRNGLENWNFSVGEVDMNFLPGPATHLLEGASESASDTDNNRHQSYTETLRKDFDMSRIKIIVPDGLVCMVTSENNQVVSWKNKLSSPIASAWLLLQGTLFKLNLFDPGKVPALENIGGSKISTDNIFMGFYEHQAYIQASPSVQLAMSHIVDNFLQSRLSHIDEHLPSFKLQPCQPASKYLKLLPSDESTEMSGDTSLVLRKNFQDDVTVCHENPRQDKGIYFGANLAFHSRLPHTKRKGRDTIDAFDNLSYNKPGIEVVYSSFLHWWKELLILTVTVSISVQCFLVKCIHVFGIKKLKKEILPIYDTPDAALQCDDSFEREYESRFLHDFEPQECLGKGGFGVVFKARNKMDDCSYAVKRILLPNNVTAREKVLREVRALAKLDHPSIVRYFHAWSEEPPPGWQKQQDESLMHDLSSWSLLSSPHHITSYKSPPMSQLEDKNKPLFNETKSFLPKPLSLTEDFPCVETSKGFLLTEKLTEDGGLDDSGLDGNGSWKDDTASENPRKSKPLKSKFFQDSDTGSSESDCSSLNQHMSIPFKHYENDSSSVMFGDYSVKNDNLFGIGGNQTPNISAGVVDVFSSKPLSSQKDAPSKCSPCSLDNSDQHKNHDEGVFSGSVYLYIQMQLCKKESLKEWLVNTQHRERDVYVGIFHQVVDAVKYVHDQGLIHRDLKPSNVFFSLDETVKIGDFGLVTNFGESESASANIMLAYQDETRDNHTKHVGTKLYMAPEQTSDAYTEKVDIYALGLILFELVFPFNTHMERVNHLLDARKLKFPPDFDNSHPQEKKLVSEMLNNDAKSRPSAWEICKDQIFGI